MAASKQEIIDKLRQDLRAWEGFRPPKTGEAPVFGLGPLEKNFPDGVFPTGVLHEFISNSPEQTAAISGFLTGLMQTLLKNGGICIWASYTRRIYPPALKRFGVNPDRIVFIDVKFEKDVLWVTEEALKCKGITAANLPQDDPEVFRMVTAADTMGTFQVESRAQMVMSPQFRAQNFYDLAIQVALVRPGPIQGNMVHPYLRRRMGKEPVSYPSEEIKKILERTLGIPLFQEQAMEIAIVAAGFSPAEADLLRRSMATFKFNGLVSKFEHKLINGMTARGYSREFAENIFKQLEGFGSYGFPESHAIAFAHLVYVSCFLKRYYPDAFAACILNSQPMGFYQPAQLVRDAAKHGVLLAAADINHSQWDYTLKEKAGTYFKLRIGFRQIKGLREEDIHFLMAGRTKRYTHIQQLAEAGVSQAGILLLANADAMRSIGLDRRQALWKPKRSKTGPSAFSQGKLPTASLKRNSLCPS